MQPLRDIADSLRHSRIWLSLALDDVASKYRRTILGPLWIVLVQSAVIVGIYLLRNSISPSVVGNFLLFLSASLPIWGLVSGMTSDGTAALARSKGLIESYPLPMTVYLFRSIAQNVLIFGHTILVFAVVSVFYGAVPGPSIILFPFGLIIVLVFGLGMHLLLAPLSARFQDVSPALGSFMTVAYIMSPVFWVVVPEQREMILVKYNPFYYLLEVMRGPLLNDPPPASFYAVATLIAVTALALGIATYSRMASRIVFWI
jgi:ABC-type polysaccharide/polyol phosphate export permease